MFCRSRLCLSISLACTALAGVPVYAEEAVELEAVTISATRAKSEAGKTPQKITVITREQIEQQLAITSDHGQILSNLIPSYSPSRQKMSSAGETFRGRSALVLIDGVPQSTPLRDSARDGYTIDMAMVERIEVIHGASAEHGLGATGGIINYVTRRPQGGTLKQHAGVSFEAPSDYESAGLGYKLDYRVEGNEGSWDYLAAASWQTRGMSYDANGTLIGVDDTQGDIMNSVSSDLLLKLGYWFDSEQNLELMVNRFQIEGEHEYVNVPGDRDAGIPATSRKGRCVVTSATRRPRVASIITTCAVPVSSARNSVCPENAIPLSLITPLCTGAVIIPAKCPSRQPLPARVRVSNTKPALALSSCPAVTAVAKGVSHTYRLPAGAGWSGQCPGATGSRLTASPSCVARSASRSRLVMAIRGWGWASAASSRHRSGPMPAGSPGVTAKRRGFTVQPGRRQAA